MLVRLEPQWVWSRTVGEVTSPTWLRETKVLPRALYRVGIEDRSSRLPGIVVDLSSTKKALGPARLWRLI
jgi:hypothetical protein